MSEIKKKEIQIKLKQYHKNQVSQKNNLISYKTENKIPTHVVLI